MLRLLGERRLRGMEELPRMLKLVQKSRAEGGRSVRWRWSPFFLRNGITMGRTYRCMKEPCMGIVVGLQITENVRGGVCSINTRSSRSISSIQLSSCYGYILNMNANSNTIKARDKKRTRSFNFNRPCFLQMSRTLRQTNHFPSPRGVVSSNSSTTEGNPIASIPTERNAFHNCIAQGERKEKNKATAASP